MTTNTCAESLTPVADLHGIALDWAVARARGAAGDSESFIAAWNDGHHAYHESWQDGGPIIDAEHIATEFRRQSHGDGVPHWHAIHPKNTGGLIRYHGRGETLLVAAMRCYVAAKLGDAVEVPALLIT